MTEFVTNTNFLGHSQAFTLGRVSVVFRNFIQQNLNSSSTQVLLPAYRRFAIVIITDNDPVWK